MVSRNDLSPGTVISSSRIFRAVSLGTCFRITSRTRSTVLLLAATRHLLQHPQGHRSFTLAVTGRASRAPRVGAQAAGFPNAGYEPHPSCGGCPLTARSRPKRASQNIQKNRCRTTVAEPMEEKLSE